MSRINPNHIDRNISKCQLYQYLNQNSEINLHETITDCLYIRDHRNGRGEKRLGRLCLNWIADIHPNIFLKILKYIPEYGRWDDLLYIDNKQLRLFIYTFISNQIHHDLFNMMIGENVSTCAKWMPTEGKSFHRHYKTKFIQLLQVLKMTPKEYRIKIATLRKHLGIPERNLCEKQEIDITKLSIGAKKLYGKKLNLPMPNKNKKKYLKIDNNYNIVSKIIEGN